MSTTTIESVILPNCRFTGSGIKLRIFLQESFVTSDGVPLQSGNIQNNRWYKEVDCTLATTNLTIPSFTIASTVDGIDRTTARYVAYFYKGNTNLGVYTGFEQGFRVPASPSTWSWADLRTYNFTIAHTFDGAVYTKDQVNQLIDEASGAPLTSPFLITTASPTLTGASNLGLLSTGLLKITVAGAIATPSTAIAGTDYQAPLTAGVDYLSPSGSGASLTGLNASALATGIVPDARFPSTLPALSGVNLTALNASNLGSGTVPDARFPATLPASSGANLTALNATNLASGTIPDARFPATLPAVSGTNLTNLNASNLSSGTMPAGRLPALTGDVTSSAGSAATTLSTTIPNVHTFSGVMTHIQTPTGDGAQGSSSAAGMFNGAYGTSGTPITVTTPATYIQNIKSGGTQGVASFGFLQNFQVTGASEADYYPNYLVARYAQNMSGATAGAYYYETNRLYFEMNQSNVNAGTQSLHGYGYSVQAARLVANVRVVGYYCETRNFAGTDAAVSNTSIDTTFGYVISPSGNAHNTGAFFAEGSNNATALYYGHYWSANSLCQRVEDYSATTFTLQGTAWTATAASNQVTISSGGHADVEVVAGDWIVVNGVYCRVASATANAITLTGIYSSFGGSGTPTGLTITKSVQATWLRVNQPISVLNTAGSARKEIVRLDENDVLRFDYDGLGSQFGGQIVVYNSADPTPINKVTLKSFDGGGGTYYPGIWFGSATPDLTNYGFLADVAAGTTIINGASLVDFRIANAGAWEITGSRHFVALTDNSFDIGASGANRPRTGYFGTSLSIAGGTALTTTNQTGTGSLVLATSPTLTTPLLGTPTSGVLTNCTGLPVGSGISGLGTGVATFLATPSSANLLAALTDKTGTGVNVFATSPSLVTPVLGVASATSLTAANLYGGSSAGSTLTLNGTSGVAAGAAHIALNTLVSGSLPGIVFVGAPTTVSTINATGISEIMHLQSTDSGVGALVIDSYGNNTVGNGSALVFRNANGTFASPTATAADDVVAVFGGRPYFTSGGTGFTAGNRTAITFRAAEAITSTAQGMYLTFETTPIGSTSRAIRMRVMDSGNVKIAGSALRGTTEGTNHLDIFDGTAPVGTLANGISLYSASGECRVMDAAGNSTLLSPHDKKTNEWIYHSVDTRTGKTLRIDMEKMMRFLNEHHGTDFIHEFVA